MFTKENLINFKKLGIFNYEKMCIIDKENIKMVFENKKN